MGEKSKLKCINLRVFGIEIIFNVMRLGEFIKGAEYRQTSEDD